MDTASITPETACALDAQMDLGETVQVIEAMQSSRAIDPESTLLNL